MLIGEMAKLSGLTKDGIRHYEQMELIRSTPRQAGSRWYKDYDAAALETIEKIKQAQRLGFSLKEIGPLLQAHAERPFSEQEALVFLEARLVVIREKIDGLREVEDFIVRKMRAYQMKKEPAC